MTADDIQESGNLFPEWLDCLKDCTGQSDVELKSLRGITTRLRCSVASFARTLLVVLSGLCAWSDAYAHELLLSVGTGPQPGGDQTNRLVSVDYQFYTFERSARQHISVGVVRTRLATDMGVDREIDAITVYPEFSYYPAEEGRIREAMPARVEPYFFTRFLGPSYMSANTLGDRRQDEHFSFLAEIGVGLLVEFGDRHRSDFRISWKHFSNANWFDINDGIDVPFVISWGLRF